METFFVLVSVAAGYAGAWYTKDAVSKLFLGATAFAEALDAKAKAVKAAL